MQLVNIIYCSVAAEAKLFCLLYDFTLGMGAWQGDDKTQRQRKLERERVEKKIYTKL